jgi:hypothetical protein
MHSRGTERKCEEMDSHASKQTHRGNDLLTKYVKSDVLRLCWLQCPIGHALQVTSSCQISKHILYYNNKYYLLR